jgi:hypothetical protein
MGCGIGERPTNLATAIEARGTAAEGPPGSTIPPSRAGKPANTLKPPKRRRQ